MAGAMDLLGRGDAAIQSLDGYMASPFAISINTYFYLFLLCKWIAVTAVSSVFFLFCICCRNQVYSILCIVTAFTGEALLWLSIEDYSWLSPIRQLNLAAIMDTSHYFNDYINFNFFGIDLFRNCGPSDSGYCSRGLTAAVSKGCSRQAPLKQRKTSGSILLIGKKLRPNFLPACFRGV